VKRAIGLLIPILLLAMIVSTALAQVGSGYDLSWSTIDGGGGASSGGGYTLNGTIGQADAGQSIGSGGYTLSGGFWFSRTQRQYQVYLPLVLR
jgi:hypothetical protein